jgi:hypothetical protein
VYSVGQVLSDEDRPLSTVSPETEAAVSLLLVPREFEGAVLGSIHAQKQISSPPSGGERVGGGAAVGGGGWQEEEEEESDEEAFADADAGVDSSCSMVVEDNGDGSYWLNFSFQVRVRP